MIDGLKSHHVNARNLHFSEKNTEQDKKFQFDPSMKIKHTKSTKFWPSVMFVKVLMFSSNHGFHKASFTVSRALHLQLPWALKAPNIPSEIITAHTNTCTEPEEAGRCGTLLVGRAEPLWRSPWRSKVVSATLLRWRETQKRGGGLIISADDKEVNRISGQTATHNITTCIRSKTNNYIKPELNGKSNKSSGPQPHEHPECLWALKTINYTLAF